MYVDYRGKELPVFFLKNQGVTMTNFIEVGAAVNPWRHKRQDSCIRIDIKTNFGAQLHSHLITSNF